MSHLHEPVYHLVQGTVVADVKLAAVLVLRLRLVDRPPSVLRDGVRDVAAGDALGQVWIDFEHRRVADRPDGRDDLDADLVADPLEFPELVTLPLAETEGVLDVPLDHQPRVAACRGLPREFAQAHHFLRIAEIAARVHEAVGDLAAEGRQRGMKRKGDESRARPALPDIHVDVHPLAALNG